MEITTAPLFTSRGASPTQTPRFLPPLNTYSSSCFLKRPFSNRAPTKLFRQWIGGLFLFVALIVPMAIATLYWFLPSSQSRSTATKEALPGISGQFGNASEEESDIEEPSVDKENEDRGEMLDKLPLKLGSDESYIIFLYGAGALVALWFSSIIVEALEAIPVFPQLMEVVGLSYTIWFSYRYLLFKKRREELASTLAELRERILGLSDD